MKKKFTLLLLVLFISILYGCSPSEKIEFMELTILSVNDLHGYIEQDNKGYGGLSNMAFKINEIRNENKYDDVVLIGNGDLFQGTAISNMTQGAAVLECMNAMEFDAMGIGNHEFDWGIETILAYFDGDESNGEADFPLLNANIYNNSDNSLLTIDNGIIYDSVIIEKEDIDVGIISYIGDVYSSISYDKVEDYYFDLRIVDSVEEIGSKLKNNGADVIIVNIHGGYSSNIEEYYYNADISELKDEKGGYLVDAVINGHTHSEQYGAITRNDGVDMPLIQAGANGENLGRITLNIDLLSMDVTDYDIEMIEVSDVGKKYDPEIQSIIDNINAELDNKGLAIAGESIASRFDFYAWIGNVMVKATGADIAFHNKGGVRGTGGIEKGKPVTIKQMYEISPFDNQIFLVELDYTKIKKLQNDDSLFNQIAPGVILSEGNTYTVAIISYVYYKSVTENESDIDTKLYIRDILIEDINLKGLTGEKFSPISNPKASIDLLYK